MKTSNNISFWMMCGLIFTTAINAHATTVSYALDNVILDDRNTQMTGTFSWTFDIGDFENGVGRFSSIAPSPEKIAATDTFTRDSPPTHA